MSEPTTNPPVQATDPDSLDLLPDAAPELGHADAPQTDVPPADIPPDLAAQLANALAEVAQHKDAFIRAKAETENLRRRMQEDIIKAHKFAAEKFATELLAVKDSLEAALAIENQEVAALRSGVELTLKQLVSAFDKSEVKEIAAQDQKFDPHWHQAISQQEAEGEPNRVLHVLQKGYTLNERVLRPALVIVSKAKA